MRPEIAPEALREPSAGPKKSYMRANIAPGEAPKSPEKSPREAQGSLKERPSEAQKATQSSGRPKMAQDRPREAQEAPRQAQEGSKMAQDESKRSPGDWELDLAQKTWQRIVIFLKSKTTSKQKTCFCPPKIRAKVCLCESISV